MKPKTKGDTIQIYVKIDADITDWKIRCEVYDNSGNSVKLATENSGGSDEQVKKHIISALSSTFIIYVPSSQTTLFDDDSYIEIEIDTGEEVGGEPEIVTIFKGNINLSKEQITWTTP